MKNIARAAVKKGSTEGTQEFSPAFEGISLNSASLERVMQLGCCTT